MKVNIKATDIKLTPDIKNFIEKKIESLRKFISHPDGSIQAWVEISRITRHHRTGDIYRAEIQITVPHIKKGIRAESTHSDLYTAIEDARSEIKKEIQKLKEKKISLVRWGARIFKDLIK